VHAALAGLIVVLALIALTSLLTTSRIGIRDHLRDVRVLMAMGLTPAQVRIAVVMRTTVLALVAVVLGAVLGRLCSTDLISSVSRLYGLGAGIGRPPSAGTLAAAIAVSIAAAAVASTLPMRTAGEVPAGVLLGP
jgi:putative ABC transport system permease protein